MHHTLRFPCVPPYPSESIFMIDPRIESSFISIDGQFS